MDGFKQGAHVAEGLIEHGEKMGFKHGGHVKASPDFVMKTGPMADMDNSKQKRQAKHAATQRQKEMGNQPDLEPGYAKGGKAMAHGKKMSKKYKGDYDNPDDRRKDSKAGMPKGVKARGGRARKPYKGYNEQPGGSGVDDKRYAGARAGGKAKKAHGGKINKKNYDAQKGPMPANVKARGGKMKYAEGGLSAAKKVMDQHIKAPKPEGHGVKKAGGGRTMNYGKGGYRGGGRKAHHATPMYGGGRK